MFAGFKVHDESDHEAGRRKMFDTVLYEFAFSAVLLPVLFLLRRSPETPPSGFANSDVSVPFVATMKVLFTNRAFVLTFVANSIYFGCLKGLSVVIPYLMNPFGYDSG